MTPEDQEYLFESGGDLILGVLQQIVTSVGYGALVLMTYIALRILSLMSIWETIQKITFDDFITQFVIWQDIEFMALKIPVIVGDGIVAWRAWVLLFEGKFGRILLATLMIVNTGLNIADYVLEVSKSLQLAEDGFNLVLDWVASIASLIINAFVTFFILWKFW
ncbi:hypothetical protein GYMLUDRAFT_245834 [Collybiopsis luxurians FD-317 M1]|uniref:Uncharacterized protein n=1 Tax=Collybiopsis luxurians FD-317 M1 TaxID=944289 RepID=A0A0D0BTJ4_9AGAR|nr:hypothetical protein GYMLUDRAFT_245834 [Collybiopsis luxurians FD-317 M1]